MVLKVLRLRGQEELAYELFTSIEMSHVELLREQDPLLQHLLKFAETHIDTWSTASEIAAAVNGYIHESGGHYEFSAVKIGHSIKNLKAVIEKFFKIREDSGLGGAKKYLFEEL